MAKIDRPRPRLQSLQKERIRVLTGVPNTAHLSVFTHDQHNHFIGSLSIEGYTALKVTQLDNWIEIQLDSSEPVDVSVHTSDKTRFLNQEYLHCHALLLHPESSSLPCSITSVDQLLKDCKPRFTSETYTTVNLKEVGPALFTARAVSQCGPVTYLSHTPLFTVASTGKVQCRERLLAGDYIIEITAQIQDIETTQEFTLQITDEFSRPSFTHSTAYISTSTLTKLGTPIYRYSATAPTAVAFTLQDPSYSFCITRTTSYTDLSLCDQSYAGNTTITLSACLVNMPSVCTSVKTVMEVRPADKDLYSFSQMVYEVTLREDVSVGKKIKVLQLVNNLSNVTYDIIGQSERGMFGVIHDTGVLFLKKGLDYELVQHYVLHIRASLVRNGEKLRSYCVVAVDVADYNDNAPEFPFAPYTYHTETSYWSLKIEGHDADSNNVLQYYLPVHSPVLMIDEESGVLSGDQMVRERTLISVCAHDLGSAPLHTCTNVTLLPAPYRPVQTVLDVMSELPLGSMLGVSQFSNVVPDTDTVRISDSGVVVSDSKLVPATVGLRDTNSGQLKQTIKIRKRRSFTSLAFTQASYRVALPENTPVGTGVIMVDVGEQTESLSYSLITSEFGSTRFSIDAMSGSVKLESALDHEEQSEIVIPVKAVGGGLTAVSEILLTVEDINDHAPLFVRDEYVGSVKDNTPIGVKILTVLAVDLDTEDNGRVSYSIISENDDHQLFVVSADSGEIKTSSVMSSQKQYNFAVLASDRGSPVHSSLVNVTIYVQPSAADPPVFTEQIYRKTIPEIGGVGTSVLRVKATLRQRLPNLLQYSLVSGSTAGQNTPRRFGIDPNTGLITRTHHLDAETTSTFYLVVKARTTRIPAYEDFAQVIITLSDANDNIPIFNPSKYYAEVLESAPPDTYITTVYAVDYDSGKNSLLSYTIPSDQQDFYIHRTKGHIFINKALDREKKHEYNFYVNAFDAGDPIQFSMARVQVKVLDVNDCAPMFRNKTLTATVLESAKKGDPVTTLTTLDQDEGRNAAVTYTILSGDRDYFSLDSSSGLVRVNTQLDYETRRMYRMGILASDGIFTANATLIINVVDVNDHTPVFEKAVYRLTTPENVPIGSKIIKVTALDSDSGINQELKYALEDAQNSPFLIDPQDGYLIVNSEIDRETNPSYTLQVSATDGGGLTALTKVIVTVDDINDNSPMCLEPFEGSVKENIEPGALVMKIKATDMDKGKNSELQFELLDQHELFSIDTISGDIILKKTLDRETTPHIDLIVKVSDRGAESESTECKYTIDVQDDNDNSPIFSQNVYKASVSEMAGIGHVVIRLDATDADINLNGALDYSITSGNVPARFEIHARTGEVSVLEQLDYESEKDYSLSVRVTDRGVPYHEDTCTVRITVTDGNDNNPEFSELTFEAEAREDMSIGSEIASVHAADVDSGINGAITYSIDPSTDADHIFSVTSDGTVVLSKPLDREAKSQYELGVVATDGGSPPRQSIAKVRVTVQDINDNAPQFIPDSYSVSITPGVKKGEEIILLSVTDSDTEDNGPPFTYSIVSGNEERVFGVSGTEILVRKPAALKVGQSHMLTVKVTDGGSPVQSSTTTANIVVIAANKYSPTATPVYTRVVVLGGVVSEPHLLDIKAHDADKGTILMYSIRTGNDLNLFTLYPNGSLYITDKPEIGTYQMEVSVSDGRHMVFTTATVAVFSLDGEAARDPLTLRFTDISIAQFEDVRSTFIKAVSAVLNVGDVKRINIISVQTTTSRKRIIQTKYVDVTFIASDKNDNHLTASDMKKLIAEGLDLIQSETGLSVNTIGVDMCLKEPCQPAAACINTVQYVMTGNVPTTVFSYQCVCPKGYTGSRCTTKVPCEVNPCLNNGMCSVDRSTEVCSCLPDWTGPLCGVTVHHCARRPCHNGGLCTDEIRGFTCLCPNGYKGPTCSIKIQPDDLCEDPPCSQQGSCSSGADDFTCTCNEGWTGRYCTHPAEDTDLCSDNPCLHGGTCSSRGESVRCECPAGFRGEFCQDNFNECLAEPCLSGGICQDGVDGYICNCPHSYSGTQCESTARPCDNKPCANGGFCYNINDKEFLCHCPRGYVGTTCQTPVVSSGYCDPSPCVNAEICTSGLYNYTCTCKSRYRGQNCDVYDPAARACDLNPCRNGAKCIPDPMSLYRCECEPGFSGIQCEENTNECYTSPCLNGGQCIDRINTYECQCKLGYTGRNCQIQGDPCLALPCRNDGKCFSVGESYVCQCSSSYIGRHCETPLTYCSTDLCRNGGVCGIRTDGEVRCACPPLYYGEYCEHMYQHCTQDVCKNGGTCIEDPEGYRCACPRGLEGPQCQALEVSVSSEGYLALPVHKMLHYSQISLKFRTASENGLLMYIGRYGGGQDYLQLTLINRLLHVKYCVGAQVVQLQFDKSVTDLAWHVVTVNMKSKEIRYSNEQQGDQGTNLANYNFCKTNYPGSMRLDECHDLPSPPLYCYKSASASGAFYKLNTDTPLLLGGSDFPHRYLPSLDFSGCIRDVIIDSAVMDLSQPVTERRTELGCMGAECAGTCTGQKRCMTDGGMVTCQCPPGTSGEFCTAVPPSITLEGISHVWYMLKESVGSTNMLLTLQLRTRIPHCLILMLSGDSDDFVLLKLVDGQPSLLFSFGEEVTPLTLYGVKLNDGLWHDLTISKVGGSVLLKMDNFDTAYNVTSDNSQELDLGSAVLSVGGLAPGVDSLHVKSAAMIGCIRDLRINSNTIDFTSDNDFAKAYKNGAIAGGCELSPACAGSPCPATHDCVDIWGDYQCQCPQGHSGPECSCKLGWTGVNCQYEINECASKPCLHASHCTDKLADFHCTCLPGFTGQRCEKEIDECVDFPCQNNGDCLDLVNSYSCRCLDGYIGNNCEIDLTPCEENPCKHGGVCTDYGGGEFGCECEPYWGGATCELAKSCEIEPCMYGSCKSGNPYVTCECTAGYSGPVCEQFDCSKCVQGKCGNNQCICYHGWSGPTCEVYEDKLKSSSPLQYWVIIIIIILSVLIIATVIGVIILRKKCMKPDNMKYDNIPKQPDPGQGDHPQFYDAQPYASQSMPYVVRQHDQQPWHPEGHMYRYEYGRYTQSPSNKGPLLQMQSMSLSTQTLDNEIKL